MDPRGGYLHVTQAETQMRRAAASDGDTVSAAGAHERRSLAAAALAAALFSFLFLTSYVFVVHDATPRGIPVAVVAPETGIAPARAAVEAEAGEALALEPYPDEPAARAAIDRRDVYGAVVVTPDAVRVLTAEAAAPAAKEALARLSEPLAAASGRTAVLEEVRPLSTGDRRGLGPFIFQLGLLIPSFAFAVAVFTVARARSVGARLAAVGAFAVLAGLLGAVAVDPLLGALNGNFWALAGLGTLLAAAVSLATAAFHAVAGPLGAALAAATLILFGNAAAVGGLPPEFLPDVYRDLGPWLPSAAAVTAVRSALYFDGSAMLQPTLVLATWAAAGLLVVGAVPVARARGRRRAAQESRA